MITFRFPASLGRGEHDAAVIHGERAGFDLHDVSERVWLPLSCLEPVIDEPDNGGVVQTPAGVYHREDDGDVMWFRAGSSRTYSWANIKSDGWVRLLVPATADRPVRS